MKIFNRGCSGYYKVLLRTTKYYSNTTKYYSSTTPILLCTTKYYSSTSSGTTEHYSDLSQNERPERASLRSTTPYYASNFTERASKTSISCEASDNFSQEQASKTSISCEASSKFHRTELPKRALPRDASDNFHRKFAFQKDTVSCDRHTDSSERVHQPRSFQNDRFALQRRAFPNFKMYVLLQNGMLQKRMRLSTVNRPRFAHRQKFHSFTTVLGDRHHVFTERVDRAKMKFAFYYSFGRSTPHF